MRTEFPNLSINVLFYGIINVVVCQNTKKLDVKKMQARSIPVGSHDFLTASRQFFLPKLVIIPITISGFFPERVPFVSGLYLPTKPSCFAAASSISRDANRFPCCLKNGRCLQRSNYYSFKFSYCNKFCMLGALLAPIGQQIRKSILSSALRKLSDCTLKGNFSI